MFKILAFGDSLTEGFFNNGFQFHPYSDELEKVINKQFIETRKDKHVIMNQSGCSGEFTDSMIFRMEEILSETKNDPYHLVCILGGTNDLSRDYETSSEIFSRLESLYQQVLNQNSKTILVAITIPQSGWLEDSYVAKRIEINDLIRHFCLMNNERVICVDFEQNIPYFEDSNQKMRDNKLWDDTLHMTPKGYDLLASIIFDSIKESLDAIDA